MMNTTFSFLFKKKIIFFGGKGGVGKTSCASAFSIYASDQGKKTLLISTDPAHSTSDIFERDLSGGQILSITSNLDCIEINPEKEAENYIEQVKGHLQDVVSSALMLQEIEKQVEMAKISPGAEESAIFYRFAQLINEKQDQYNHLVFDTAPTGHTLRLLGLPEMMNAWIDGMIKQRKKVNLIKKMWENLSNKDHRDDKILKVLEERRDQFERVRNSLMKKDHTTFVFVLTPEKLPILETEKGIRLLEKHNIPVEGVIVNKILPDDISGRFFENRKRQEEVYIKEIQDKFKGKSIWYIFLAPRDIRGIDSLRDFS